jgi:hypothetical protein
VVLLRESGTTVADYPIKSDKNDKKKQGAAQKTTQKIHSIGHYHLFMDWHKNSVQNKSYSCCCLWVTIMKNTVA